MAKACESLELALNLKLRFESICAEVFSVICQYVTCFIQRTGIYQSLIMFVWKWIMSLKKEITEDLRKRVDVAHQARKGYKTTSKVFGLHKSTVRQIVYKRRKFKTTVTFPRRLSANKDHSEAEREIVCEVVKVPWVTSKQLKAFLTLANVDVHEPIKRTLHGRVARRKPLFSKKKIAC